MNSFQRVTAAVGLRPTDRPPVLPQVFGHAAKIAKVPLDDYVRSGELLARCQLRALAHYGYDAVFAVMGVGVETEAAGSVLEYRPGCYPFVRCHAISASSDLDRLPTPNPRTAGRMPELLRALEILRCELGDEVLVVGCVLGPMTVASQLLGLEATLNLSIDDPERFGRLLDYAVDLIVPFAKAQIDAGGHLPVVFEPSASPAVVPPGFFREFLLPRLRTVFARLKEAGAIANWLHIAGPTAPILPLYVQAGADIANFDYSVSAEDAIRAAPGTCLDGNIRPLSFVDDTPDRILLDCNSLLDRFSNRGGFILSPGCEIPPEANPENVAAMVSAAREKEATACQTC